MKRMTDTTDKTAPGAARRHTAIAGAHARTLLPRIVFAALCAASAAAVGAAEPNDGEALRAELRQHYPSFSWVERYRQAYPAEVQGNTALWGGGVAPARARSLRCRGR